MLLRRDCQTDLLSSAIALRSKSRFQRHLRRGLRFARIVLAAFTLIVSTASIAGSPTAPSLVIEDNDFLGPTRTNIQSVVPLLANKDVRVLGFTVVTGDGWLDEETASLLRFLEITGRPDIPVVKGAEVPLVNSRLRLSAWEASYGRFPWKGAWSDPAPGENFHPDDPNVIPLTPDGPPRITAQPGVAAAFLIEQVHRHPGEVTIIACGPLTNVALAIRLDPDFAHLAKELVFGGAYSTPYNDPHRAFSFDFNVMFDPEAAHIALTANWRRIVVVGDPALSTDLTPELVARIAGKQTPVTRFLAEHAVALPLWDELVSSVAIEPLLIRRSFETYLDVDTDPGAHYGSIKSWVEETRPHRGERMVNFVQDVDVRRFTDDFVRAAQSLGPGAGRH